MQRETRDVGIMHDRLEHQAAFEPVAGGEIDMAAAPGERLDQAQDLVMGQRGLFRHAVSSPLYAAVH